MLLHRRQSLSGPSRWWVMMISRGRRQFTGGLRQCRAGASDSAREARAAAFKSN